MRTTAWILSGAMALALGCASEQPTPAAAPVDGYSQAYYNGKVVHFDQYGQPYYLEGGESVFIDKDDPRFEELVWNHHANKSQYRRVEGDYR